MIERCLSKMDVVFIKRNNLGKIIIKPRAKPRTKPWRVVTRPFQELKWPKWDWRNKPKTKIHSFN